MPTEACAPGRVELLGNHTDYNQGVVLAAAIDRRLKVSGERRSDGLITLRSVSLGKFEIRRENLRPQSEPRWVNYVLGVVRELLDAGLSIDGFSAEIEGDLPSGCGLSSSAAIEVATAFFLLKLFDATLPPLAIAKLCQRAEHRFVGVRSGLLDQVTTIFGRAGHAVFFDARSEEVRVIPFPPGLALIIAESGKKRELAEGLYNQTDAKKRAPPRKRSGWSRCATFRLTNWPSVICRRSCASARRTSSAKTSECTAPSSCSHKTMATVSAS